MARKRFAQHWLVSDAALQRIVAAARLQDGDRLLEIGPGRGALTRRLLDRGLPTVAVEIDRDLCRLLVQRFGGRSNFLLLQGDVLDLDWEALLADFPAFQQPNKVVANIPYNITGPILERLLGTVAAPRSPAFEDIVLLLQKEVAQRLCARPGSKAYGALTVRAGFLADCEWICDVPARAFSPPPKVDSAVVRLTPRPFDPPPRDRARMAQLVALGFANRRKMLRNNLKAIVPGEGSADLLASLGLDPEVRAERLSVADWVRLSDRLGAQQADAPAAPDP